MKRRHFLQGLGTAGALSLSSVTLAAQTGTAEPAPANNLSNADFQLTTDRSSGSVTSIVNPRDPARMSWCSARHNAPWQSASSDWGLGYADLGAAFLHRGRWQSPDDVTLDSGSSQEVVYTVGPLKVTVTRRLQGDACIERYSFSNTGALPLPMNDWTRVAFAISTPFNDHYTNSADVLEHRCHTHVWAGGASSWVATFRMGGRDPHLGLVLTEGALDGYSIVGRDETTSSNTRGTFMLHPAIADLQPGQMRSIEWALFWHNGWEDFFAQCARRSTQFVRVDVSRHTAFVGESIELKFTGRELSGAKLNNGDQALPLASEGDGLRARFTPSGPGETTLRLRTRNGGDSRVVLNAVPPLDDLIAARVRFIARNQQIDRPDTPLHGAFVLYDNEANALVTHDTERDRNEGRERVAMGVLLARWLRQSGQRDEQVLRSLQRYYQFVTTRLQRPDGYVLDAVDKPILRLYNWPWVAQLHLEYARLTGSPAAYAGCVRTIENYYANDGAKHYSIGIPVYDSLRAFKAAGLMTEHARLLQLYEEHGRMIMKNGTQYPPHEVNFEQSIVAPAALFLLELHLATGGSEWLNAARPHLALLELFSGRQPDHHLHEVAIRHWDGYWFGKKRLWGDTFPHYWSTLSALVFQSYAKAGGRTDYARRAEEVVRNNLSLFTPDGRGSAAFIYPLSVNGLRAHTLDPYANDQDWALVHALQIRELH
jgi:hypothetical protein